MARPAALPALAAVCLSLAACTAGPIASAPPAGAQPTARELVDARRGGMAMSVFTLSAVGSGAASERPVTSLALPTRGLASFARSLPGLFRDDTAGLAGARARAEIWTDRTGFAARVAEFQSATAAMEAAAAAGDRAALEGALASTKAACKACHDSYRAEP